MACECVDGCFCCGRCGSDDPPKVGTERPGFVVRCIKCGYSATAESMRDAMHKWEKDDGRTDGQG